MEQTNSKYSPDENKELYEHVMDRNRSLFIALLHIKHLLATVDLTPITRQEIEAAFEKVGL